MLSGQLPQFAHASQSVEASAQLRHIFVDGLPQTIQTRACPVGRNQSSVFSSDSLPPATERFFSAPMKKTAAGTLMRIATDAAIATPNRNHRHKSNLCSSPKLMITSIRKKTTTTAPNVRTMAIAIPQKPRTNIFAPFAIFSVRGMDEVWFSEHFLRMVIPFPIVKEQLRLALRKTPAEGAGVGFKCSFFFNAKLAPSAFEEFATSCSLY